MIDYDRRQTIIDDIDGARDGAREGARARVRDGTHDGAPVPKRFLDC